MKKVCTNDWKNEKCTKKRLENHELVNSNTCQKKNEKA